VTRALTLIYDDTLEVPADVAGLVGIDRFGSLLYQRRRLREHALAAGREAGLVHRSHLRDPADRLLLAEDLADSRGESRCVYLTADVVCGDRDLLVRHLARVAYAEEDLFLRPPSAPPGSGLANLGARSLRRLMACRTEAQRREWISDQSDALEQLVVEDLVCLSSSEPLTRFLAGTFHTRAFNRIDAGRRTLRKRSADREKIKREHDYWYFLPPRLQRFVAQPFGLQEGPEGASYEVERFGVTDFAMRWVHGPEAVSDEAIDAFLDAVFEWFAIRDRAPADPARSRAVAESLYRKKLDERLERLLGTEAGLSLDRLISAATPYGGGVRDLQALYHRLLDAEWAARPPQDPLALTHGDLCFSNILYDQRSGLMRFIDPRGATSAEELWSDPYYDVAKLSHSVLGGYDFIHHDLFDVVLGEDQRLVLRSDRPDRPPVEALFLARVREAGFDPVRMRLYEASLFLSMLPLHAEAPRKLAAFALTAVALLEEVERGRREARGGLARWWSSARGR
jgi:hypothetical protein